MDSEQDWPATLFDWAPAPRATEWGAGMVVADVEIDKDNTLSIYARGDQANKVAAALRQILGISRAHSEST